MGKYYCGQSESYTRKITEKDPLDFAAVSEDFNPIHIDKNAAENSIFQKQVAHGMLVTSMFSSI